MESETNRLSSTCDMSATWIMTPQHYSIRNSCEEENKISHPFLSNATSNTIPSICEDNNNTNDNNNCYKHNHHNSNDSKNIVININYNYDNVYGNMYNNTEAGIDMEYSGQPSLSPLINMHFSSNNDLDNDRIYDDNVISLRLGISAMAKFVKRFLDGANFCSCSNIGCRQKPYQIILVFYIVLFIALGLGSSTTVKNGVISEGIITNRYSRLHYGYTGLNDCSTYIYNKNSTSGTRSSNSTDTVDENNTNHINTNVTIDNFIPSECKLGLSYATKAGTFVTNVGTVVTILLSTYIGSLSDKYGRKAVLVVCLSVVAIQAAWFLLLVATPWQFQYLQALLLSSYYVISILAHGIFPIAVAIVFSSLSDVVPKQARAISFGLILAAYSFGFVLASKLVIATTVINSVMLSLFLVVGALLGTVFWMSETFFPISNVISEATAIPLQPQHRLHLRLHGEDPTTTSNTLVAMNTERLCWVLSLSLYNHIQQIGSVLNRNRMYRLLSVLAFVSGFVSTADQTLLLYYIEEPLHFNHADIEQLFIALVVMGILMQAFMLKYIYDYFGERRLILFSFALGRAHTFLYGIATNHFTIYIAIIVSASISMAFPAICAIAANHAESSEHGRIQGVLAAVSTLASAIGPVMMRFVYHYTQNGAFLGKRSLFVCASGLYTIAVICSCFLPLEANSKLHGDKNVTSTETTSRTSNLQDHTSDAPILTNNNELDEAHIPLL